MRRYPITFLFPTGGGAANETSPAEIVSFCRDKVVQIGGTFTATVAIQGRVSPTDNYVTVPNGSVTAPGVVEISAAYYDLKIVISGYASGAVTATFAGFNVQPS